MSEIKPLNAETKIEPSDNPFMKDFLLAQRKESELLMNSLEEAIKEKIYGAVRVYSPFRKIVYVEVYNDRFDFKYAYDEKQMRFHDTEMIVFDFLHHYRKEILKRYIKKEGGIEW